MEDFVNCSNASTAAHKSIVMKYTTDNASSSWFWTVYNGNQRFYFYYGSSSLLINSTANRNERLIGLAIGILVLYLFLFGLIISLRGKFYFFKILRFSFLIPNKVENNILIRCVLKCFN